MTQSSTCTFRNARDQDLSARLEQPDGPVRATAVFAHCFTCSKDLKAARAVTRALAARGIAVLSFDFAGLGSSDGDFAASTFSFDVDDLVAAAGYLAEVEQPPTLLVGHSLGGAAVLAAAARLDDVRAVATIGAPADVGHITHLFADELDEIEATGEAEVTLAGRPFTIRSSFVRDLRDQRLLHLVGDLDMATLFLHGPLDDTVGVDNARLLFEASQHPKSFVSLDDADHLLTDLADARYAAEVIASWAARYLSDAGAEPAEQPAAVAPVAQGDYADAAVIAVNRGGLTAEVTTRGFRMQVDEPRSVGGTETGPTPYEYLGAALASCTSMTVRMYAERKGLPLEEVTTSVTFDRVHAEDCADCETIDARIELFTRTLTLAGDLDPSQRDKLLSIANRCPVHRTLEGTIEVQTTLEDG